MSTRSVPQTISDAADSERTTLSRVAIELDAIRHTLGSTPDGEVPFGTRSDFICTARYQIAALRLIVIRTARSGLQGRMLEIIDRMESELDRDAAAAQ